MGSSAASCFFKFNRNNSSSCQTSYHAHATFVIKLVTGTGGRTEGRRIHGRIDRFLMVFRNIKYPRTEGVTHTRRWGDDRAPNDIPVASDPLVGPKRGSGEDSQVREKGLKEAEEMLAQNVIFPSIAPSHVLPTPSPSLFLSSPPLSDCAQDNADRDGGGVPNEVHKSGSRSPFSCVRPTPNHFHSLFAVGQRAA